MSKYLVGLFCLAILGCSPAREVVQVIKGDPGTSCSVADLNSFNEEDSLVASGPVVGAKITCTDGTSSIILNGATGATGATGAAGTSCTVSRPHHADYVSITCGSVTNKLYDGEDGRNGRDGEDGVGCRVQQLTGKVKLTCGNSNSYAYIYDGEKGATGAAGTSCTVTSANGGANIKCGSAPSVFLANGATGPAGSVGPQGQAGRDGLNGTNGEDAVQPGLSCNLHDLRSWDSNTSLPAALAANPPVGNFILANLSVPDSQASAGFPGMPSNLQNLVGKEGYALDCSGYINVATSGQHTLKLLSDDGSYMSIEDGYLTIQNQGLHAPATVSATGNLNRGPNKINVVYYQGPYTQIALQLKWIGPNTAEQVVPASAFTH